MGPKRIPKKKALPIPTVAVTRSRTTNAIRKEQVGTQDQQIHHYSVPIEMSELRPRIIQCNKCLQTLPPAKLAEHFKSCEGKQNQKLSSKGQEPTPSASRTRSGKRISTTPEAITPKFPPLRLRPPTPSPRPHLEMELVEPIRVPKTLVVLDHSDPLLLELDPNKRRNLLTLLLIDYIRGENEKHLSQPVVDVQIYTVNISNDWRDEHVDELMQKLLTRSSEYCLYCRQAALIRVDRRQLVLHLLICHRFQIKTSSTIRGEQSSPKSVGEIPEQNEDKLLTRLTPEVHEEPELEVKKLLEDIVAIVAGENESENRISRDADGDNNMPESVDSGPAQVPVVPAITIITTIVNWNEFQKYLLEKVFQSSDLIFYYDHGDIAFGQTPCECLLCGQRIRDKLKLYSHWKSTHKAMAMSCGMCSGQFLYCGSLFSHHCFGTPKPFQEASQRSGIPGAENLTIHLRYQCEFCDAQLPGFFNYMVHLRKLHNKCELCFETCSGQAELERHHRGHKLHHFCWKCGTNYVGKSNFWTRLYWKHGAESKTCHKCLGKKWPFLYHFCLPPPTFTCEICKLQFTKAVYLFVHKRVHTNEKLRKCPSCSMQFISKKLLQKHLEGVRHEVEDEGMEKENEEKSRILDSDQYVQQSNSPTGASADIRTHELIEEEPRPNTGTRLQLPQESDIKVKKLLEDMIARVAVADDQSAGSGPAFDFFETAEKDGDMRRCEPEDECTHAPQLGLNLSEDESEEGDENFMAATITCNSDSAQTEAAMKFPSEVGAPEPITVVSSDVDTNTNVEKNLNNEGLQVNEMTCLLPPLDMELLGISAVAEEEGTTNEQHILNCASVDLSYSTLSSGLVDTETNRTEVGVTRIAPSLPVVSPYNELSPPQNNNQIHASTPSSSTKAKPGYGNLKRQRCLSSSSSSSSCSNCNSNCSRCSSSSSSSSSSSGSACGSNCSCSRSSSESEQESNQSKPQPHYKIVKTDQPLKLVLTKLNSQTSTQKGNIVTAEAPVVSKRRRGRPRKIRNADSPDAWPPKSKGTKGIALESQKRVPKHLKKMKDAFYIPESDLETDWSDSEETFDREQIEYLVGIIPAAFEEVWERSNESFLLQILYGVKSLEGLRPKPKSEVANPTTSRTPVDLTKGRRVKKLVNFRELTS